MSACCYEHAAATNRAERRAANRTCPVYKAGGTPWVDLPDEPEQDDSTFNAPEDGVYEITIGPAVCDLCQTAPDACLKPYGCVHTEAGA